MLKTTIFRIAISISCLLAVSGIATADTKIKSRQTSGGQTYENTSYIKGKRQRTETNNGQMVVLQQCDLRRNVQMMPQVKAYVVQPYDQPASTTPSTSSATSQPSSTRKGGVVTSTVTTRDTGERKQMFGYTARRIITTMVTDSSPDACSPLKSKMEIDGWYIDAAFALECDSQRNYTPYNPQANSGCQDRYETKQIGLAKKGLPVWEKMTMFGQDGAESFATINEVVELSQATLDPTLFDVPNDYREVKDFASAYSSPSTETAEPNNTSSSNSGSTSTVKSTPATPQTNTQPAAQENKSAPSKPASKIKKALGWP